ncbi:MAG TPA: hypothetical protein VJV77_08405 [Casimicrobiaceae bacterium]|nr:hypothetical protein [Casimicrobiaceae bacterium]
MLRPGVFLVAALATIFIAGAYTTRYMNAVTPDAMDVVPEPVGTSEEHQEEVPLVATIAESKTAGLEPVEAKAVEAEPLEAQAAESATASSVQTPIPAADSDAAKRASVRQVQTTAPATKRAGAHSRPAPDRRAPVRVVKGGAHRPSAASVRVPVADISKNPQADRWHAMYASLARCSGDLSARIVCDERVRRQFCEGHWNNAPACANGVFHDHGQ